MGFRHLWQVGALAGLLAFASQACAVEIIFTGKITSGIDNGAIFAPVGTNLAGQDIQVVFDYGPVDAGTTSVLGFIGASVTVLGHSYNGADNDFATPLAFFNNPDEVIGRAEQNFNLGYSDTAAHVASTSAFLPPGADLNASFRYKVKPGDDASGYFDVANTSTPDLGYAGPPYGGPGATPPWSEYLLFSVNGVYVNTPVTTAVPEPATWTLMLSGLGGLGLAARRRRGGRPTARIELAVRSGL